MWKKRRKKSVKLFVVSEVAARNLVNWLGLKSTSLKKEKIKK